MVGQSMLWTTFCLVVELANVCCAMISDVRVYQVLEAAPGSKLCALDAPSDSLSLNSVLDCALECQRLWYCENFNYNIVGKTCDLFFNRPNCYGPSPQCTHYQIHVNQPYTGIADEKCHIPFTYKKRLYHECGFNLTLDGCMQCLNDNWTLVQCHQPAAFVVQSIQTTISVPTFPQPIPVISVNRWIVFLYRFDGSVPFNETWINYRNGFGDPTGEYWLGLEELTQMTNNGQYKVRFEFKSIQNESWFSAEYDSFQIDPEWNWYKIHVSGYAGDAGDLFEYPNPAGIQNGMNFTTWDSDNDRNSNKNCCFNVGKGGWWYNACGAHFMTNPFGSIAFYNRWLTDLGLATDSRLNGARAMIQRA